MTIERKDYRSSVDASASSCSYRPGCPHNSPPSPLLPLPRHLNNKQTFANKQSIEFYRFIEKPIFYLPIFYRNGPNVIEIGYDVRRWKSSKPQIRLACPMCPHWDMATKTFRISVQYVGLWCTRYMWSGKGWIVVGLWAAGTLRVAFMAWEGKW